MKEHILTEEAKLAWNAAIALAGNLCVQISDTYNSDDQTMEAKVASECARKIRSFVDEYTPLEDIGFSVPKPFVMNIPAWLPPEGNNIELK